MRLLFSMLVLCVALTPNVVSVAAQSEDSEIVDGVGSTDDAQDQPQQQPTPTPQVIYVVVTATPVSTVLPVAPPVLYPTRKGPRSEDELRSELASAGYGGPWDTAALIAAYERTTAPTPTPVPLPPTPRPTPAPDYSGPCFQISSSLSLQAASRIGPLAAAAFNPATLVNVCLEYARQDGMAGVQCTQFALQQEMDFIAIAVQYRLQTYVAPPSINSLYRGCMGR
jgi:hypothetical protein